MFKTKIYVICSFHLYFILKAISGESGRTTAHLMSALDDRFYILKKYHGDKVLHFLLF